MKKIQHLTQEHGAALIIVVFFFIAISMAIVQSATIGALSELRTYSSISTSKLSYVAAEAGIEDMYYRTITSRNVPASQTIVLNGATSTINVTDVSATQKEIYSTGEATSRVRRLYMNTSRNSIAVQFPYGAQVGAGGITMSNNAFVDGTGLSNADLYSNGSITGAHGVYVTGNVISGSSVMADETASSSTCGTDQLVGKTSPNIDYAQSFRISTTTASVDLFKVSLYIKRVGNATGANIRITTDNGGKPAVTALATQALSYTVVSTNYGWVDVIFTAPPTLDPATTYWIVLDSTQSASKYWYWCRANADSYPNGTSGYKADWTSAAALTSLAGDMGFKVILGGGVSQIDNVIVSGLAKADVISNSAVTGNAYYQSKPGTTVSGTSFPGSPTPPAIPMPISDAEITQWKSDATAGGVINGNCGSSGVVGCKIFPLTIGPKKIAGNLSIDGDMTITGTLYVTGNITSQNGSNISCAPGYGVTSCVVLADGYISLGNNSRAYGSGTSGSYILLLSTLQNCIGAGSTGACSNNSAIDISNNVNGALFYTTDSQISISNNAAVTAVVGYKIDITNNGSIVYNPDVANITFSTTASGGSSVWAVTRWNEY